MQASRTKVPSSRKLVESFTLKRKKIIKVIQMCTRMGGKFWEFKGDPRCKRRRSWWGSAKMCSKIEDWRHNRPKCKAMRTTMRMWPLLTSSIRRDHCSKLNFERSTKILIDKEMRWQLPWDLLKDPISRIESLKSHRTRIKILCETQPSRHNKCKVKRKEEIVKIWQDLQAMNNWS